MKRDKEIVEEAKKIAVRKYKNGLYSHDAAMDSLIDLGLSKLEAWNRLAARQDMRSDDGPSDAEMRENYFAEQHNNKMEADWQNQF